MRRLGTWLGAPVVMAAAAYGFYWYQVKSNIDDMVAQLSPFASVQYGAIHAHPNGTVGVNSLTISPHQVHAPVSIDQVRVRVGSPLYLLFGGDEPPEELFINLGGVEQSLDSALFHDMQKQMSQVLEQSPLYVSPTALGCGSVRQFDINSLRMMGYRDLRMDIDLHYRGDEEARSILFDARVDVDKMGDTRLKMAFSADPAQLKNPMMATGTARLEQFEVDYQDRGYNKRVTAMCAREAEMRPSDFPSYHQALFERWLAANAIEMPGELLDAYKQVQQEGMSLSLALHPIGGFGSAELMMLQDPTYLIEKLNPILSINDTPVELAGIQWNELLQQVGQAGSGTRVAREGLAGAAQERSAASDEHAAVVEPSSAAMTDEKLKAADSPLAAVASSRRSVPVKKRYRVTPLDELGQYLGKPVRIFTYFGNDVEGRLMSVDAKGIRVMQRMEQGMAEYPLDRARIQQAEVYR
ncbi:hypothetical protein [Marinobacterium weihaiense]|uniref:Uncharacterized protein n=1 Tax=Marinobacterium weihaiense TaxID=2851016 RepID=A0ABS6M804_9GAMM|nr:hypothetical protein [Marinobacterium weihaiense]MBV0932405.1 hypothetical protein [Marinobacterium weihaiense]